MRPQWREPEPGEIRVSGHALYTTKVHTFKVRSCEICARTLGAVWQPDFFEGTCRGCDCRLEP